MHGHQVAMELLSSVDVEGRNPLDWACEAGHFNIIEFFIRRGLNPYRIDVMNRNCLYWAVKANRLEVVRFLVQCGCDPLQKDVNDISPSSLAYLMKDHELIQAVTMKSLLSAPVVTAPIATAEYGSVPNNDPTMSYRMMYRKTTLHHRFRSLTIFRKNPPAYLDTFLFFIFFFSLWLLPFFLPFYAVIPAYLIVYRLHR
jgi:hypothetical protein